MLHCTAPSFPAKMLPIPGDLGPSVIHGSVWLSRSATPDGILIESAVFPEFTVVTNGQTDLYQQPLTQLKYCRYFRSHFDDWELTSLDCFLYASGYAKRKCSVNMIARAQQWAHSLGKSLYESGAKLTAIMDIKTVRIDLFWVFVWNNYC